MKFTRPKIIVMATVAILVTATGGFICYQLAFSSIGKSLRGCSWSEHVSPTEFEESFAAVGLMQDMASVTYLGQHDGRAYINISSMPLFTEKWGNRTIFVELSELDQFSRDVLLKAEKKATTRPAGVPSAFVPTASHEDVLMAATFKTDAALQKAVSDYVKPVRKWTIIAGRPIGDYILLWILYPDIADGGVDVIYSKKERRIVCEFNGGEGG